MTRCCTPTATCVALSVWSEARWNNTAKKNTREVSYLEQGSVWPDRCCDWKRAPALGLEPGTSAWARSVGHPPRLFPHHWGPRGLRREVGSLLHNNLLGCGWERLRPTVLTMPPLPPTSPAERESKKGRERKTRTLRGWQVTLLINLE